MIIMEKVTASFGVALQPEPVFIGFQPIPYGGQ